MGTVHPAAHNPGFGGQLGGIAVTGKHSPRVKYLRRLAMRRFREQEGKFLVEGIRFVEEALKSDWPVELLAVSPGLQENRRGAALLEKARVGGIRVLELEDSLFGQLAETDSPQGIIALLRQRRMTLADLWIHTRTPDGPALLVLLDGIQDPGNLGTIIRSADAAGVQGVLLLKGTADIYNPKSLRATMGSIFHLPVLQNLTVDEVFPFFKSHGIKTVAGDPRGQKAIYECDLTGPCVLVAGSEGAGAGGRVLEKVAELARIPMPGCAESFNVAVSLSIMLYEAVRQRAVMQDTGPGDL